MIFSESWIRTLVKTFLRVAFRLYYRSIQVKGLERLPQEGPVLLVANHPNSLVAIDAYSEQLRKGHVTAIFPEGLSQDDPRVVPIKSGAARIALQTESSCDFRLGLKIVPVGLQFGPRRSFRADGFVRFGEPFTFEDLAALCVQSPKQLKRSNTPWKAMSGNGPDPERTDGYLDK